MLTDLVSVIIGVTQKVLTVLGLENYSAKQTQLLLSMWQYNPKQQNTFKKIITFKNQPFTTFNNHYFSNHI